MQLLALLRFEPPDHDPAAITPAIAGFAERLPPAGGRLLDHGPDQVLAVLDDPHAGFELLSRTLDGARRSGFGIFGGLVQPVQTRGELGVAPGGITERTMETLVEIAAAAGRNQIAITSRLLSTIELTVPVFARRFKPQAANGTRQVTRVRSLLVME